jgi:phosphatidate cytidylyltransferase|tara:strand:+ start:939 stop:1802 length:864 start_codon:yes stop_codon:yes gene_type:complete
MLKQRIATAIVLLVGLIAASTLMSPFAFSLLTALVVLLAAWEWGGFIGLENLTTKVAYIVSILLLLGGCFFLLELGPETEVLRQDHALTLSFLGLFYWVCVSLVVLDYPSKNKHWNKESRIATMGIFSLLPTWVGITQLKYLEPNGMLVLVLIILVAAVDVGAFFTGMNFGKTKLAPELSPNKTWEGVWGGFALCLLVSLGFGILLNWTLFSVGLFETAVLILISALVTFFSVTGDLVESMLKRNRKIKDSGTILPGHGGVLDRVDGLIAATPVFVLGMTFLVLTAQ